MNKAQIITSVTKCYNPRELELRVMKLISFTIGFCFGALAVLALF